jgi:hypothetical protein
MEWLSSSRDWLTRHYLNYRGEYLDNETYTYSNIKEDVYWFSSRSSLVGQATPFNTITLNDYHLSNLPDFVTDYVFLHEVGHTRLPFPLRLIFYILALPLGFLAVSVVVSIPILPVSVYLDTGSIQAMLNALLASFIFLVIGVLPFVVIVRLDEIHAELFAINRGGEALYRSSHDAIRTYRSGSLRNRIRKGVFYPSTKFILWLYRRFS